METIMAAYENGLAGAVNGDGFVLVPVIGRAIEQEWARRNNAQITTHQTRPVDDGDRTPDLYREFDDFAELDARRDRVTRTIRVWRAYGEQADRELTALVMYGRTYSPCRRAQLEQYGYSASIIDQCPGAFPPAPLMSDAELASFGGEE
jgi:hypothetical protein